MTWCYDRSASRAALAGELAEADVVVHLEALYRSADETQFEAVNGELTRFIAQTLDAVGHKTPDALCLFHAGCG